MSNGQKGGWLAATATAILVAVLASGNRPWWLGGEAKSEPKGPAPIHDGPAPTPEQQKAEPPAEAAALASSDFMVGRWRVDQNDGIKSDSATATYYSNGRFEGHGTRVVGYMAQPMSSTGLWHAEKVSDKMFRMEWRFDTGNVVSANFKVLDKDHVQNLDQNYVAERLE